MSEINESIVRQTAGKIACELVKSINLANSIEEALQFYNTAFPVVLKSLTSDTQAPRGKYNTTGGRSIPIVKSQEEIMMGLVTGTSKTAVASTPKMQSSGNVTTNMISFKDLQQQRDR